MLDDDPARKRQLQLPGDDLASVNGALLQDADRGGIGQGLRQEKFSAAQTAALLVEQVKRAYYLAAQAQRQRVRRPEPSGDRLRSESRPAFQRAVQVNVDDRGA